MAIRANFDGKTVKKRTPDAKITIGTGGRAVRALIAIICLYFAHADGARAQSEVDTAFSAAELLAGKTITEAECKTLRPAVWVVVESRGECIRYYHSAAGGEGKDALVLASDPLTEVPINDQ